LPSQPTPGVKPSQRRKSSGRNQGGQPWAISDPARGQGSYAALEQPLNQANAFVRQQQVD